MRVFSRCFLPILTIWLAVMPARSYAIAPAIPILVGVVEGFAATGTTASALESIALGTLLSGVIYNITNPNNTLGLSPLIVPLNPKQPLPTPPGWTPAANGIQPTPPASTTPNTTYSFWVYPTITRSTPQATCDAIFSVMAAGQYSQSPISAAAGGSYNCNILRVSDGYNMAVVVSPASACAAGYVASGTSCALSNPLAVQKPSTGTCSVIRTGNTYAVDPQNPDCAAGALPVLTNAGGGFAVTASNVTITNADGRRAVSVLNADGTATITITSPNAAAGTTSTTTVNVSAPNATTGATAVTGVSTSTVQGTGTAVTTTAVPTIDLKLPTDYNREATQTQILTATQATASAVAAPLSIAAAQTSLTDAITAASAVPALIPTVADMEGMERSIPWVTWLNPFAAFACTPFTFNMLGRIVVWDFCAKIAVLSDVIGWMLAVYTAWELQSLVFRRSA